MGALLWTIAAGAFALLASGLCLTISEPESAQGDEELATACCLAALGLCIGSLTLV